MRWVNIMICSWLLMLQPSYAQPSQPCKGSQRPIIYVHGFLGSGDNWAAQAQRFEQDGWCPDRLLAFDWNSIDRGSKPDSLLDMFIRKTLQRTGADKVILVAHSAGGGVCSRLLSNPDKASRVSQYIHVGSSPLTGPPGGVPMLNLYSAADRVAQRAADVPGAQNKRLLDADHLQVVTSAESYEAMRDAITGGMPAPKVQPQAAKSWVISGKAVVLGENTPLKGCQLEAWEYDTASGKRLRRQPDWQAKADSNGAWNGFQARSGAAYEFVVRPVLSRPIHYFYGPIRYHQRFVYLRSLPTAGMAAMLLAGLPADSSTAALAIFASNGAIVHGRDSLVCNGQILSNAVLTPAAKSCFAMFVYDAGKDQQGAGKPIAVFSAAPFLNGTDQVLPAGSGHHIQLYFNGRKRVLPSIPSQDGVMVAVFD